MERKIQLSEICRKYSADILYGFGSLSKKVKQWIDAEIDSILPHNRQSDVDVGVKPLKGKIFSLDEKVRFSLELEDLFSVNRVDLVIIPEADPFLAANIIRGERIFCQDDYRADEYDLYILRRAGDLAPLERERQSIIMKKSQLKI